MELIEKQSVILFGGTYDVRQIWASRLRDRFHQKWPSGSIFTLSEYPSSWERFLKSARNEFPIGAKLKNQTKPEMSFDQLNDSLLDWTADYKHTLIVLPELGKLFRKEVEMFYELIGRLLVTHHATPDNRIFRFIMTLEQDTPIEIQRVPALIGGTWRPSENDVALISAVPD